MSQWSGESGRKALDKVPAAVWGEVASILNNKGIFFEGAPDLPGKDVLRAHERGAKIRLRKAGYLGKALVYIEENVQGCNGYAFFCKDKYSESKARAALRSWIIKQNDLG